MKTKPEVSAALFVRLESYDFKIDNPCVLRFKTEYEAEEFLFGTLVKFGQLRTDSDGSIWLNQIRYGNRSEAIKDWQFGLGVIEYFHIYECRDVIQS